ncbi:MAG: hypothetical protein IT349_06415 [Candidatus Eisenbacteria bacterium]|nr:hypothetical protein [Candidatus Eisenbacteria bacterium]
MLRRLLNSSGGLRYHQRAFTHADSLWVPYREAVAEWLEEWPTDARELILFGPSGGYTLPVRFLARFERITCLDPDPLAPIIFRLRHRTVGSRVSWIARDVLLAGRANAGLQAAELERLLAEHPRAVVLFAGLLGQILFLLEERAQEETWPATRTAILRALEGREWASIHDRLSGSTHTQISSLLGTSFSNASGVTEPVGVTLRSGESADLSRALPDDALRTIFRPPDHPSVFTHGTEEILPSRPRRLLLWQLEPGWTQIMECVRARD